MYELYPYFTNDGSVGLFSQQDDDIYHSTYGALTESWQKFILPAHLQEYLTEHEEVKILDICYGIGYNTKTALNVFIENILNKNDSKKFKVKNFGNIFTFPFGNISSIYTDNIFCGKNIKNKKKFNENHSYKINNFQQPANNIEEIDTDNIQQTKNTFVRHPELVSGSHQLSVSGNIQNKLCKKILIDAVDIDKTLIKLSPFITNASWFNFLFKSDYEIPIANELKYKQIKNIKNFKKFIQKDFKLNKAVSIILIKKLFESKPEFFNDAILQTILTHKKYAPFLSRFMINFAKFYQNQRYNYNKKKNNLAFLHNIYYKYISKSYKSAEKLLTKNKIDLNFYGIDARNFIKSTANTYNFMFLDAFTPSKCPELWTVQFFRELYSKLEDDGMILTYSNSAAVRNGFLQAGFTIGKIYDSKLRKFTGTVAAKNKTLIEHNLDELDMDLINSKAGICFKDENLSLSNKTIIENRKNDVKESELISSSKVLKGHKNDQIKSI